MDVKLIKKGDIILAICIAAICAAAMGMSRFAKGDLIAVVTVGGEVCDVIDLGKVEGSYTVELDTEPEVTLLVERNAISFIDCKCPDKLCEKSGKLSRKGSAAVCLPAKTVITIEGSGGVDAVTY